MSDAVRLLMIHALSPIHCGAGEAAGGIDLPIAREKPTRIPLIPGSTCKGALRAAAPIDEWLHKAIFGPDTANAHEHAGSVQFADARLAFLPVRSACGTFAWVTSPYMLRRLGWDAKEAGLLDLVPDLPPELEPDERTAFVTGGVLPVKELANKVLLEDYDLHSRVVPPLASFATRVAEVLWPKEGERTPDERRYFAERLCVVHHDVMALLLETSLEIVTRVRLEPDKKVVAPGAVWTEEALPVESILVGLVMASPVKLPRTRDGAEQDRIVGQELLAYVDALTRGRAFQMGGKTSVGRGLCRLTMGR